MQIDPWEGQPVAFDPKTKERLFPTQKVGLYSFFLRLNDTEAIIAIPQLLASEEGYYMVASEYKGGLMVANICMHEDQTKRAQLVVAKAGVVPKSFTPGRDMDSARKVLYKQYGIELD